jgi:predicted RNase H-like HicB family nuclease
MMPDNSFYMRLPWTIARRNGDDNQIELTIAELPEFMVHGATEAEAEERFWPALETIIESYTVDGEAPPIPAITREQIDLAIAHSKNARINVTADKAPQLVQADNTSDFVTTEKKDRGSYAMTA